jgi:hypothetical protein
MTFYIDEAMLKGFYSWEAYGYALSEAYYTSCLQSGMPEHRAFESMNVQNSIYLKVENFEMTNGRFQFALDVAKRFLLGGCERLFPRTAPDFEQEGYNFASSVFDSEMKRLDDDIKAVHAYMVHRREIILNDMPPMNRTAYRKGYVRFCGETAEQLATHFDAESRGIQDPVAYLEGCLSPQA